MSLIGSLLGWVKGKTRLFIEYALITAVVALAGYAVMARHERVELNGKVQGLNASLVGMTGKLDQQIQIGKDQDHTIAELQRLRLQDESAIAGLQEGLSATVRDDHAVRSRLDQLERNNAAAQSLLGMAVPRELGCVLDGTPCPASGDTHGR
jgi:hypothetical protein